jgi:hypothetical protein
MKQRSISGYIYNGLESIAFEVNMGKLGLIDIYNSNLKGCVNI